MVSNLVKGLTSQKFILTYFVLLTLELTVLTLDPGSMFRFITKPALLISLLWFFLRNRSQATVNSGWITGALAFSLLGDVLLMFTDTAAYFFMAGLFSFLLAHVCYCKAFFDRKGFRFRSLAVPVLLLMGYGYFMFSAIGPYTGGLKPYVSMYMIVILFMVLCVYSRTHEFKALTHYMLMAGALLFVLSDSILALNKFGHPFDYASQLIMLTYGLAQLLLVLGILNDELGIRD